MRYWIDPPEGWRWGFPRVWDSEVYPDAIEWIIQCGYPRNLVAEYGSHFHVRQWIAGDSDS